MKKLYHIEQTAPRKIQKTEEEAWTMKKTRKKSVKKGYLGRKKAIL